MANGSKLLKAVLAACLAFNVTMADTAYARETELKPSSNWAVNYAPEKCRLLRLFGEGKDRILLYFEQYEPNETATMFVAGEPLRHIAQSSEISLQFGPGAGDARKVKPQKGKMEGFDRVMIFSRIAPGRQEDEGEHAVSRNASMSDAATNGLPHIAAEDAESIEWMTLSARGWEIRLLISSMSEALEALNNCSRDLLREWDLDIGRHETMTREAEPINLEELARQIQRFYPQAALRNGEQADLNLRIIVNADGSIAECTVEDITTTKYIKSNACDVFGSRAMFSPAQDAERQPMKSYYSTRILYRVGR